MHKAVHAIVVCAMGIGGMIYDNNETFPILLDDSSRDIEWIYSRPGMLKDLAKSENKRVTVSEREGPTLGFADVAEWTLAAVFDDSLVHEAPYLTYSEGRKSKTS